MHGNMVQNCQIYESKILAATFINTSFVIIVQFANTSIEKEFKLRDYVMSVIMSLALICGFCYGHRGQEIPISQASKSFWIRKQT